MSKKEKDTPKPFDNCDGCGNDYELHRDKDILVLYLLSVECNHIEATCPHCGATTRIYVEIDAVLWIIKEAQLTIRLAAEAPSDIIAGHDTLYYQMTLDIPPELPGWVWRQLGDDIRKFERDEIDD